MFISFSCNLVSRTSVVIVISNSCTEEKEEEMAIEIQEVLSTEDTDAQKTKSEENVEVVEVETKLLVASGYGPNKES
jgi:hypothetical protein